MSQNVPQFRLHQKGPLIDEAQSMSDIEKWVTAIVSGLVALMSGGSAIWVVWRKRKVDDDAADLKNNQAATKFLREELFKILARERAERTQMHAEMSRLSEELLNCARQHAAVQARLELAEEQLDKLTNWQNLIKTARSDMPDSLGETKKG